MVTPGSVWKLKGHAYFTVVQNQKKKGCAFTSSSSRHVYFCYDISTFSIACIFPHKAISPFVFLLSSILPDQEHAITKCYTNHYLVSPCWHWYGEHCNIIVISFLTSSLHWNQFTGEGKTQLREATYERNCYPGFVELNLYLWYYVY